MPKKQKKTKNRDWQTEMSNTTHQRNTADLKAAGLNPALSAMSAGGTPAGATASSNGTNAVDKPNSAETARAAAAATAEIQNIFKQNKNLDAQTEKTKEETKNVEKYGNQLDALTLLHTNSAETEARKRAQIDKTIEEMTERINILQKQGKYTEAKEIAEILDRMRPNSTTRGLAEDLIPFEWRAKDKLSSLEKLKFN
jgi:hypothetical protein